MGAANWGKPYDIQPSTVKLIKPDERRIGTEISAAVSRQNDGEIFES